MKALWQYDNGILDFKEVNEPQIYFPDDIKIKVHYSTIGIQDLFNFHKWNLYSTQGIAGYEMSGEIVDLGSKAKEEGFYVGQKVSGTPALFCGKCVNCLKGEENNCLNIKPMNGTICQYVVWKSKQCVPMEEDIDYKSLCLLEPVATVSQALNKMHIWDDSNLCIFGGDFNALVMIQLARFSGMRNITVVEPKKVNRDLAKKLGAKYVLDPAAENFETELMKITDFIGFENVAVTSTADTSYVQSAINCAAKGAVILMTVYFDKIKEFSVNSVKMFSQNITITSSFLYTKKILQETKHILNRLNLDCLIPVEYQASQAQKAWEEETKNRYPRIGLKIDF
jgi:threonine dehydrogenase-like Zn-dependent dehydrogenase